jgi:hypothetical protein
MVRGLDLAMMTMAPSHLPNLKSIAALMKHPAYLGSEAAQCNPGSRLCHFIKEITNRYCQNLLRFCLRQTSSDQGSPYVLYCLPPGMAGKTSRLFEFEGIAWHFWEDEYDQKVFSSTATYGQRIQPVIATQPQNLEFLKLRLYEDIDRLAIESCVVQTHSSLRGDLQLCLSAWPTQLP